MYIFDAHTHFFSRAFYEFQAALAPHLGVEATLERFRRYGVEVPDPDHLAHRDRIVQELDECGIDRAVTIASAPTEMEIVGEAAKTSFGRLVPFAMINPRAPETVTELERLLTQYRFRGIVLFPTMHDYGIRDEVAVAALDLARRYKLLVFVHCGLLRISVRSILGLNPDFPLDRGHPDDLIPVARERRDQTFIVPHFGAGFFDEFLRLGRACPNVYADTAGSNTWGLFQAPPLELTDLFEQTAGVFGPGRILYGSDTAGFPRGYRRDVLDAQLQAMSAAGFSEHDREMVMGGNLSTLLGD